LVVIGRADGCVSGAALRTRLAGEPLDALSQERIATAALLLRSICPNDGDVEILLHEMARTLERIADVHDAYCRATQMPTAEGRAVSRARS
jgi:hypothetical protein